MCSAGMALSQGIGVARVVVGAVFVVCFGFE